MLILLLLPLLPKLLLQLEGPQNGGPTAAETSESAVAPEVALAGPHLVSASRTRASNDRSSCLSLPLCRGRGGGSASLSSGSFSVFR